MIGIRAKVTRPIDKCAKPTTLRAIQSNSAISPILWSCQCTSARAHTPSFWPVVDAKTSFGTPLTFSSAQASRPSPRLHLSSPLTQRHDVTRHRGFASVSALSAACFVPLPRLDLLPIIPSLRKLGETYCISMARRLTASGCETYSIELVSCQTSELHHMVICRAKQEGRASVVELRIGSVSTLGLAAGVWST